MKTTNFYSDMADECAERDYAANGLDISVNKVSENIVKTRLTIKNDAESKRLNRAKGKYVTLECKTKIVYKEIQRELAKEIKNTLRDFTAELIKGRPTVLVAGLGNRNVTADALGSLVIDGLIVTRSVIESDYSRNSKMLNVAGIATGVFGMTGIESLDIVKGVAERIGATLIIVIDTLASAKSARLFKSFQLTNAGLEPGSASGAGRQRIDFKTTGIPVIAVGVPLALYARSMILDAIAKSDVDKRISKAKSYDIVTSVLGEENLSLILTPKEIDEGVKICAKIIAEGINMCFQNKTGKSGAEYI